jgi:hypothetical protein
MRKQDTVTIRLIASSQAGVATCAIPGCGRPTMASSGKGLAQFHCRYHVQFKARHGSHWAPSYKAPELKPYVTTAAAWVAGNSGSHLVRPVLMELQGVLAGAGRVEPAQNLKRRPAAFRAQVAFARLREAGIGPERILAIYLGITALIEDDRGSHRTDEYRMVQTAKALHRLASGTHKRWDIPMPDGRILPATMDVYPKSSGRVLRAIGDAVETICRGLAHMVLEDLREAKTARFGPHPSTLPGWKPLWQRQRENAAKAI